MLQLFPADIKLHRLFGFIQNKSSRTPTRARALALAPLSRRTLAIRWWPQWAATWRGVKWSSVISSISALYCSSCLTQSMWSPWAAMWMGDRPFCERATGKTGDVSHASRYSICGAHIDGYNQWRVTEKLNQSVSERSQVQEWPKGNDSDGSVSLNSSTLVFAWMGAPCSSRISMMRTWPFRAAQWRGVSSSWEEMR